MYNDAGAATQTKGEIRSLKPDKERKHQKRPRTNGSCRGWYNGQGGQEANCSMKSGINPGHAGDDYANKRKKKRAKLPWERRSTPSCTGEGPAKKNGTIRGGE